MLPANPDGGGTSPAAAAYRLIAAARTQRVTSDNTLQSIIQVTAQSIMFLVTFTWFVEPKNWTASGAPGIVPLKTSQVNTICAHEHVIGFRSIQDQDASRLLNNYTIITVGREDGSAQNENDATFHPVRMDQVGGTLPFDVIDALYAPLAAVGV
jgi:hypothetical protein